MPVACYRRRIMLQSGGTINMYEKNRILIAGVNSEEEFDLAFEVIKSDEEYITDKDLIFKPQQISIMVIMFI